MKKIVIRTPNHLGDCIMARPAVKAFAEQLNDIETHLLLPDYAQPLFEDIHGISYIPVMPERLHGHRAITYQTQLLRGENFDIGIALPPSFSSGLILFLSDIKERFGYPGEGRSAVLNRVYHNPNYKKYHRSRQYRMILEYVAKKELIPDLSPIHFSDQTISRSDEILSEMGKKTSDNYIVIAPRAVAESRRWGTDNYHIFAKKIIERHNLKIVLLGTANEHQAGEEIKRDSPDIINLCGKTDLYSAGAVMQKAALFVGNDSGLAHLAAAVGTPLVVLSGADDPSETSPVSKKKTVIIKDYLDCISCVKNICPREGDYFMKCMKDISVDDVLRAAEEYLG